MSSSLNKLGCTVLILLQRSLLGLLVLLGILVLLGVVSTLLGLLGLVSLTLRLSPGVSCLLTLKS